MSLIPSQNTFHTRDSNYSLTRNLLPLKETQLQKHLNLSTTKEKKNQQHLSIQKNQSPHSNRESTISELHHKYLIQPINNTQ